MPRPGVQLYPHQVSGCFSTPVPFGLGTSGISLMCLRIRTWDKHQLVPAAVEKEGQQQPTPSFICSGFLIAGAEPVNPACKTWPRALSPFKVCPSLGACLGVALRDNIQGTPQDLGRGPCPRGSLLPPGLVGQTVLNRAFGGKVAASTWDWMIPCASPARPGDGLGMVRGGG